MQHTDARLNYILIKNYTDRNKSAIIYVCCKQMQRAVHVAFVHIHAQCLRIYADVVQQTTNTRGR